MTKPTARDIFPLAEPFELVAIPSGEITYDHPGYRWLLLDLAHDYSPLFAVRMDKVWKEGTTDAFKSAAQELLNIGYRAEADILLGHLHRGVQ